MAKDEWTHNILFYDDPEKPTVRLDSVKLYIDGHLVPLWVKGKLLSWIWWKLMKLKERIGPMKYISEGDE